MPRGVYVRTTGESARSLARQHGVSDRTMRQCLAGETWRAA